MIQNNATKKDLYEILDAMQGPSVFLRKNMGNGCPTMKCGFKYSNISMDS
jgi:hypothetical protein